MNLHLTAIAADVASDKHAVLLLDQAGWHLSKPLTAPGCLTIVPLPPKCPSSIRRKTSGSSCATTGCPNRVFNNDDDLLAHCCAAWNKLEAQPWRIMSIGLRDWAHRS
jgi:putative transposase